MDTLTQRQRQVAELIAQGNSRKQIGVLLGVSTGTISRHMENIYNKLNLVGDNANVMLAIIVTEYNRYYKSPTVRENTPDWIKEGHRILEGGKQE